MYSLKNYKRKPAPDSIHRQPDGSYRDEAGKTLSIEAVFHKGRLHCFSGETYSLIVTEWNVNRAMFFVLACYY